MLRVLSICAVLGLAACGDIAAENPDAFSMTKKDGVIAGTFNPAGWTPDEVQKFIQHDCANKKLARFTQTAQPNGLVAFEATCT